MRIPETKGNLEALFHIDNFLEEWKKINIKYSIKYVDDLKERIKPSNHIDKDTINFIKKLLENTQSYYKLTYSKVITSKYSLETFIDNYVRRYTDVDEAYITDLGLKIEKYIEYRKEEFSKLNAERAELFKIKDPNERLDFLNKIYDEDIKIKRESFMQTILNNGGNVLRVVNLTVGNDGQINGYVSCEKCDLRVETIGAGGYNIQRFHYRLLVHKLNERVNNNIEEDLKNYIPPEEEDPKDILEEELKEKILTQASRLESKTLANGKSRGKDIWDKINDLGYTKLLEEKGYTKWFDTPSYPIYKVKYKGKEKLGENPQLIFCMAFAYVLPSEATSKNDLKLFWNVEGTDSMSRIEEIMSRRNHDEYSLLVKLMAKRGTFKQYGEPEKIDPKEEAMQKLESEKALPSLEYLYENKDKYSEDVWNLLATFSQHTVNAEKSTNYRGVDIWKRIVEFGYDKKFEELGYEVLIETPYYPILYKEYPEEKSIYAFTPTLGYVIEPNKHYVNHRGMRLLYSFSKSGQSSKLKDIKNLFDDTGKEEFEILHDCLNGRKKLTPYASKSDNKPEDTSSDALNNVTPLLKFIREKDSSYNADLNLVRITNSIPKSLERYEKVKERFLKNNYDELFKDSGVELIDTVRGVDIYTKTLDDCILIFHYQAIYIMKPNNKLPVKEYFNVNSKEYNLDMSYIPKFLENNPYLISMINANNLRKKLVPYSKNKSSETVTTNAVLDSLKSSILNLNKIIDEKTIEAFYKDYTGKSTDVERLSKVYKKFLDHNYNTALKDFKYTEIKMGKLPPIFFKELKTNSPTNINIILTLQQVYVIVNIVGTSQLTKIIDLRLPEFSVESALNHKFSKEYKETMFTLLPNDLRKKIKPYTSKK